MPASKSVLVAVAALALLTGCGGGSTAKSAAVASASSPATAPASSAAPAVPAPPTTTPAATETAGNPADPQGQAACDQVARVMGTDDLYNPDAVEPIGKRALQSTNTSLRLKGQLLLDRVSLARAGKGGDDQFSTTVNMGTTATEMATLCLQIGYTKP